MEIKSSVLESLEETLSGLKDTIIKEAENLAKESKKEIDEDIMNRATLIVLFRHGSSIKQLVLNDMKAKNGKI